MLIHAKFVCSHVGSMPLLRLSVNGAVSHVLTQPATPLLSDEFTRAKIVPRTILAHVYTVLRCCNFDKRTLLTFKNIV